MVIDKCNTDHDRQKIKEPIVPGHNYQGLKNDQIEKCLSLGYFVLEADYKENMTGRQVSFLPLSYALKDKVDDDQDDDFEGVSPAKKGECKTKARPVSDASHRSNFHTPSVNDALVPLTDLWTEKIQPLLLKFRTAKQLALGDISQYFHRLRLDLDSVSMTRVIWRKGGIGGSGQLTTMFIPSASMGLTPVPALASHCRARTADMIDDPVAQESIKKSYVDDLHLATLWDPRGRFCWTLSAFLSTQKSAQKSKTTQKSALESKSTLLSAQKSAQTSGFAQKSAQMSSFTQKRAQMSKPLKKVLK